MNKIKELLSNKKKRCLIITGCIIPLIIVIVVLSLLIVKDVKQILSVVEESSPQQNNYYIESMDYLLRDNATDYQIELFNELNQLIADNASDLDISKSVVKNYVADFYTWTNKAGQYDVGGMYYVMSQQINTIYTQARDGMYKYINEYIDKYGSSELLEVDNVEVEGKALDEYYVIDDVNYDAFEITAKWSYVQGKKFDTSKFATKLNFIVVITNGHYEIVKISEAN